MLGFDPIVAKGSNDLEFERPTLRDKHVWESAGSYSRISIGVFLREVSRNLLCKLGFAIRPDAALKLFKWHTTAVNGSHGARNVIYELLHLRVLRARLQRHDYASRS
jgi:hypothetical protein